MPIAHKEYPAKSKKICPEKAKTPSQASNGRGRVSAPNTVLETPLSNESAKTVFLIDQWSVKALGLC